MPFEIKATVKVTGGQELQTALRSLSARVSRRVMKDALTGAAEPIRRRMSQLAPREPGAPDLAENIVISSAKNPPGTATLDGAAVAVGPSQPFFYGFYQEYGTAFMGAQPFMRPAWDAGVLRAISDISRALWTELAAKGVSQSVTSSASILSDGPLL